MPIFLLTPKGSMLISGFNMTEEGKLWITKINGQGVKIAEGKKARDLHAVLLDLAMTQFPCIIENTNGNFATNVNIMQENEEVE